MIPSHVSRPVVAFCNNCLSLIIFLFSKRTFFYSFTVHLSIYLFVDTCMSVIIKPSNGKRSFVQLLLILYSKESLRQFQTPVVTVIIQKYLQLSTHASTNNTCNDCARSLHSVCA